ncbi:hypothetical protein B9Z55_027178 [Caenorhabditis nigoni]|uniref:Uncharacterized protein n=1 Tax=Caenorhabditis nigoni TaxID=1611254 RepID=A0A2G5SGH6_9PELO|nr:hypothetical protein B9Z55_027178 [Caenorhabditis nigoni]
MSGFFDFIGFGAAQESNEIAPKTDDESFESGDSSFDVIDSGDEASEGSIASSSSFEKLSEDSGEEEEKEDIANFEVVAADSADLLTQLNDWFREDIAALIGN